MERPNLNSSPSDHPVHGAMPPGMLPPHEGVVHETPAPVAAPEPSEAANKELFPEVSEKYDSQLQSLANNLVTTERYAKGPVPVPEPSEAVAEATEAAKAEATEATKVINLFDEAAEDRDQDLHEAETQELPMAAAAGGRRVSPADIGRGIKGAYRRVRPKKPPTQPVIPKTTWSRDPTHPNSRVRGDIEKAGIEQGDKLEREKEAYKVAYERVYKIIDKLQQVHDSGELRPEQFILEPPEEKMERAKKALSKAETEVDVMEPLTYLKHWSANKNWRWPLKALGPKDAISLSKYVSNEDPISLPGSITRERHFRANEYKVPAVVLRNALGGGVAFSKDVDQVDRPQDLIIFLDGSKRSYMGGKIAYDSEKLENGNPSHMATGSTLSSGYQGGMHNDRAIDGATGNAGELGRFDDGKEPNDHMLHQTGQLWSLGSKLLDLLPPDEADKHGSQEERWESAWGELFTDDEVDTYLSSRPPAPARPAPSDNPLEKPKPTQNNKPRPWSSPNLRMVPPVVDPEDTRDGYKPLSDLPTDMPPPRPAPVRVTPSSSRKPKKRKSGKASRPDS